jgi:hypothetical protein
MDLDSCEMGLWCSQQSSLPNAHRHKRASCGEKNQLAELWTVNRGERRAPNDEEQNRDSHSFSHRLIVLLFRDFDPNRTAARRKNNFVRFSLRSLTLRPPPPSSPVPGFLPYYEKRTSAICRYCLHRLGSSPKGISRQASSAYLEILVPELGQIISHYESLRSWVAAFAGQVPLLPGQAR